MTIVVNQVKEAIDNLDHRVEALEAQEKWE